MVHKIKTDAELIAATKALLNWFESQGLCFGDAVQIMAGATASLEGVGKSKGRAGEVLPLFLESYAAFREAM